MSRGISPIRYVEAAERLLYEAAIAQLGELDAHRQAWLRDDEKPLTPRQLVQLRRSFIVQICRIEGRLERRGVDFVPVLQRIDEKGRL